MMDNNWPPDNPFVKETVSDQPTDSGITETQRIAENWGKLIGLAICAVVGLGLAVLAVIIFVYMVAIFVYGLALVLSAVF